jgi:large subunit ribosomal protein L32
MPVPKRKRSRARRDSRFANKGLDIKAFTYCKTCVEPTPIAPHQACLKCGFYKGSKVLETKSERGSRRQEKQAVQEKRTASQAAQEPEA